MLSSLNIIYTSGVYPCKLWFMTVHPVHELDDALIGNISVAIHMGKAVIGFRL